MVSNEASCGFLSRQLLIEDEWQALAGYCFWKEEVNLMCNTTDRSCICGVLKPSISLLQKIDYSTPELPPSKVH